LFSPPLF
jgi:nucleolar GTP-binding protein